MVMVLVYKKYLGAVLTIVNKSRTITRKVFRITDKVAETFFLQIDQCPNSQILLFTKEINRLKSPSLSNELPY